MQYANARPAASGTPALQVGCGDSV